MSEAYDVPPMSAGERLARAVLMFYSVGAWDFDKAMTWLALTGDPEATTKVLGDLARAVLEADVKRVNSPANKSWQTP